MKIKLKATGDQPTASAIIIIIIVQILYQHTECLIDSAINYPQAIKTLDSFYIRLLQTALKAWHKN